MMAVVVVRYKAMVVACALVEWDAIKELVHVEDGINRDARHTHITRHARVVRIVPAVRREVKGH